METSRSEDKSKAGGQDRVRINTHEEFEVRDWAKRFGVTKDELIEAAKAAGPMAKDVEAYLKSKK